MAGVLDRRQHRQSPTKAVVAGIPIGPFGRMKDQVHAERLVLYFPEDLVTAATVAFRGCKLVKGRNQGFTWEGASIASELVFVFGHE